MFTQNRRRLLALTTFPLLGVALPGCSQRPDPATYGEVITEVPKDLNQPFPMPELEVAPTLSPETDSETPEKSEPGPQKPAE